MMIPAPVFAEAPSCPEVPTASGSLSDFQRGRSVSPDFADLIPGDWYADNVAAYEFGPVPGCGNGRFGRSPILR